MSTTTEEVFIAYLDCLKRKKNKKSAIEFQLNLASNIRKLRDDLNNGTYQIGPSRVFVVTNPQPREVWAAEFRDRIVHHLIYNRIGARIEAKFSQGSCACIPGRGTLYGSNRLEKIICANSNNWSEKLYYLKMDISNFFVSIQKQILDDLITKEIDDPWLLNLFRQVIWHDPTQNYILSGNASLLKLVPKHKSLFHTLYFFGLAIGNLSSQFLANILMDCLDKFVENIIVPLGYVRYVDDFILIDKDLNKLRAARDEITEYLWANLQLTPNPTKTVLNEVCNGVSFVGRIVKPWHTVPRAQLTQNVMRKIKNGESTVESINSTLGLLRQSKAYRERKAVCFEAMKNGYTVSAKFDKVICKHAPKLSLA